MTGAARIPIQHSFLASRLAVLPALLLRQLDSIGAGTNAVETELLLQNPQLLLHALEARHAKNPAAVMPLTTGLHEAGTGDLHNLISHSALQLVLHHSHVNHLFLARHWHLSRCMALAAAALARLTAYADPGAAAACGLLLRAGMLVLEQRDAEYAMLTETAWQQPDLLGAEQQALQTNHIEAGVRLLEAWQVDTFCIDALRYQALPLEQVLDAAPLVRICWYSHALATAGLQATPQLLATGQQLLGLVPSLLRTLLTDVAARLTAETLVLGLPLRPGKAPAPDEIHDLQNESQQHLLKLRQEVSLETRFARYPDHAPASPAALQTLLASVLHDAGIEPQFIVLTAGADNVLRVHASSNARAGPAGLSVVCATGRSALATAVLADEVSTLSFDTPQLTVIDRQLISLLGGGTVICESIAYPGGRTVLLLGTGIAYLRLFTLRRFLRHKLQQAAIAGNDTVLPAATLLYRQQVREAVHEASNPLTIIRNYLQILEMRQGDQKQNADEIRIIKTEMDRVAAILANMLEPVPATLAVELVDLNKLVAGMHRIFVAAFASAAPGRNVKVSLNLAEAPALISGDANVLKQILTNLVKNAEESIDSSGSIALSTAVNFYRHDRFYVQLAISDTGCGIAPDLMQKLFKQETTTKDGQHRGSGLLIVKRLVDDMQGHITCQSDSKGTAIFILFPQVAKQVR